MEETEISIIHRSSSIISELRSISNIKFGEYWNTSTISPQKANVITSIVRTLWYTNEGREITITYLSTLIDKTFSLIEDICYELKKFHHKKYIELIKNLKVAILNSQNGIINLKGVYYKDEKIKGEIDSLIKNIKDKYHELRDSEHFSSLLQIINIPYQSPSKSMETQPLPIPHTDKNKNKNKDKREDEEKIIKTPE